MPDAVHDGPNDASVKGHGSFGASGGSVGAAMGDANWVGPAPFPRQWSRDPSPSSDIEVPFAMATLRPSDIGGEPRPKLAGWTSSAGTLRAGYGDGRAPTAESTLATWKDGL